MADSLTISPAPQAWGSTAEPGGSRSAQPGGMEADGALDSALRAAAPAHRATSPSRSDREDLAIRLNAELRDATPQQVLAAALDAFPGRVALVSSFGAESAVLLHMLAQVAPATPVLFLDTGMLFGQTLDYRRQLAGRLGLTGVRDLRPTHADLALNDPKGLLHRSDIDACCGIRKVAPLDRALGGFDAWVTGRKRFHGGDRLRLRKVEHADGKLKFNPLADWTKAELDAYAAEHDLPPHPLVAQGFPSVGCWPCTQAVDDPADVRGGRWAGSEKTECGIHVGRPAASPDPSAVDNVGGDI